MQLSECFYPSLLILWTRHSSLVYVSNASSVITLQLTQPVKFGRFRHTNFYKDISIQTLPETYHFGTYLLFILGFRCDSVRYHLRGSEVHDHQFLLAREVVALESWCHLTGTESVRVLKYIGADGVCQWLDGGEISLCSGSHASVVEVS